MTLMNFYKSLKSKLYKNVIRLFSPRISISLKGTQFPMENNIFTIRTATRNDSKKIFDFIVGIATYEKMLDEVEGNEEDILRSIFDEKQAEVIIGEENGIPVGFALFFHNYSTFKANKGLYLEDLYVNPSMRGKGYGKALLLYLANLARERGCKRMEWCCLDWNTPSIEFYKSLGATPMNTWTTYRLDAGSLDKLILNTN